MEDISLKIIECRGDFWLKLNEAIKDAGGSIDIDFLSNQKLKDIVDELAQNGIRMIYSEKWHIDKIR